MYVFRFLPKISIKKLNTLFILFHFVQYDSSLHRVAWEDPYLQNYYIFSELTVIWWELGCQNTTGSLELENGKITKKPRKNPQTSCITTAFLWSVCLFAVLARKELVTELGFLFPFFFLSSFFFFFCSFFKAKFLQINCVTLTNIKNGSVQTALL